MSLSYTYTSATRDSIIDALETAHADLERAAAFADAMYHHNRATKHRDTADKCLHALGRIDRDDAGSNVIAVPFGKPGGAA